VRHHTYVARTCICIEHTRGHCGATLLCHQAQLDQSRFEVIDTWSHGADVGRKYGALNGDCEFLLVFISCWVSAVGYYNIKTYGQKVEREEEKIVLLDVTLQWR